MGGEPSCSIVTFRHNGSEIHEIYSVSIGAQNFNGLFYDAVGQRSICNAFVDGMGPSKKIVVGSIQRMNMQYLFSYQGEDYVLIDISFNTSEMYRTKLEDQNAPSTRVCQCLEYTQAVLSPHGTMVAVKDHNILEWSTRIRMYSFPRWTVKWTLHFAMQSTSLCFSPNNQYLHFGSDIFSCHNGSLLREHALPISTRKAIFGNDSASIFLETISNEDESEKTVVTKYRLFQDELVLALLYQSPMTRKVAEFIRRKLWI